MGISKTTYRLLFLLLLPLGSIGQDPNFSQFFNNPVYYNPATTAMNGGYTVRLQARNLWAPIPGRFNSYSAGFEAEMIPRVGLGVMGFSDVGGEGLLRTVGGYLSYSYRAVETKNFMWQLGVSGGIINKYVDWTQFTFSDQLHEVQGEVRSSNFIPPNSNNVMYADFGAGTAIRFNHTSKKSGPYRRMMTTIGFGIHHLNQPTDAFILGFEYLPIKYTGHLKSDILVEELILSPAVIYERQNQFQTFSAGMALLVKPISVGVWFRNRSYTMAFHNYDSFIFVLGTQLPLQHERSVRLTYSIDFTLSRLRSASFGSHELSLIMNFDNRYVMKGKHRKQKRRSTYKCPDEFMGSY